MPNYFETVNLNLPQLRFRFYSITTSGSTNTAGALGRILSISAVTLTGKGDNPELSIAAHKLYVGDFVIVAGINKGFGGAMRVTSVVDANKVAVFFSGADALSPLTLTSATATQRVQAQRVVFLPDSGNSADVSIGPDSGADWSAVGASPTFTSWVIDAPRGSKFDLADWYAKSSAASQKLKILYI